MARVESNFVLQMLQANAWSFRPASRGLPHPWGASFETRLEVTGASGQRIPRTFTMHGETTNGDCARVFCVSALGRASVRGNVTVREKS